VQGFNHFNYINFKTANEMYFNLKYKVQPFYASVFDTFEFIFDAVFYLSFSVLLTPPDYESVYNVS